MGNVSQGAATLAGMDSLLLETCIKFPFYQWSHGGGPGGELGGGLKVTLDYKYIEVVQHNHRNNSFSLNFSVRDTERKV